MPSIFSITAVSGEFIRNGPRCRCGGSEWFIGNATAPPRCTNCDRWTDMEGILGYVVGGPVCACGHRDWLLGWHGCRCTYCCRSVCLSCGMPIFIAVPDETTAEAIRRFAADSPAFRDDQDARAGWIQPGEYCPNGCHAVSYYYGPPPDPPELQRGYRLLLRSPGKEWHKVVLVVKRVFSLSLTEARDFVKQMTLPCQLAAGHL
jgi:hypothetical protein